MTKETSNCISHQEIARVLHADGSDYKMGTLVYGTYEEIEDWCEKNDIVFFDPPYTRKFQTYSPYGVFGEEEHIELSEWFKSSPSKNMIILNKDDFTHSLYKDYIVEEYDYKYSIQYRDRMKHEDSNTIHFVALNYGHL